MSERVTLLWSKEIGMRVKGDVYEKRSRFTSGSGSHVGYTEV